MESGRVMCARGVYRPPRWFAFALNARPMHAAARQNQAGNAYVSETLTVYGNRSSRRQSDALAFLALHPAERFYVSRISWAELAEGLERRRYRNEPVKSQVESPPGRATLTA